MDINYEVTTGYMRPALKLLADMGIQPKSLLDIGANMGHFTHLVHSEWPDVEPICIEVNTDCKKYLKEYDTRYVALGNKNGKALFYKHPRDPVSGGNSLYLENSVHFMAPKTEEVETQRLDDLHLSADLIKLDVQGGEVSVLQGGKKTFRNAKAIITEGSFLHYNQRGCLIDDILAETRDLGFRLVYMFGPAHGCHWSNGRPVQTDLLLVKEDLPVFSVL